MTIAELQKISNAVAHEKGWWDDGRDERNTGEILALIHSEVSEALEEYRRPRADLAEIYYGPTEGSVQHLPKPLGFPIELADVMIRVADLAQEFGIDLEGAIQIKTKYNKTRPYRHGGKRS